MRRAAALVVLLSSGWAAPAEAVEPCLPLFTGYGDPAAEVTCTCGPPRGLTLNLGELLEDLEVEQPKYAGTLEQTVGPLYGTWTYSAGSNVCKAAMHAGLFATMDEGGQITLRGAPGCSRYESTWQNGWQSTERGQQNGSFYFPALTLGGCPDQDGYGSKYQGPPAFELLKAMAGTSLPGLRITQGAVEHPLRESFTVEKLLLAPKGKPPILVGRLTVTRADMENLARRFPPRYLTLAIEGLVLPTALLDPLAAAALGGGRVTLDARLDLRYDMQSGRLTLNEVTLDGAGQAWLWLRGEIFDLRPTVLGDPARGPLATRPHWLRLRLEDRGLVTRLLGALAAPGSSAATLAQDLAASLTAAPGGVRAEALRSQLGAWLRDQAGPPATLELYLQPEEGTAWADLLALLGEPERLAATARLAAAYRGEPLAAHLPAATAPRIELAASLLAAQDRVVVRYANMPGKPKDWIAIGYVGRPLFDYQQSRYLDGATAGEIDFGRLAPGFYEVRAFADWPSGGYVLKALAFLRVE